MLAKQDHFYIKPRETQHNLEDTPTPLTLLGILIVKTENQSLNLGPANGYNNYNNVQSLQDN